jgi:hypothetical protein
MGSLPTDSREGEIAAQVARFAEFCLWLQLDRLYKNKAGTRGFRGTSRTDAVRRVLNWSAMRASGDPSSSPFRGLGTRVIRPKTAVAEILGRASRDAREQLHAGAPSAAQIDALGGAFQDYLFEDICEPRLEPVLRALRSGAVGPLLPAPEARAQLAEPRRAWLVWAAALALCAYFALQLQPTGDECVERLEEPPRAAP